MAIEFRLPDVGEGLEEAEIVRWLVGVGEAVDRDQSVVEVQTDKALVEIPAPAAGTIRRLEGEEGAFVKVGDLLFVIDNGSASVAIEIERDEEAELEVAAKRVEPAPLSPEARRKPRVKAAPSVRRLGVELGVDLGSLVGSGPGGRVTADDVRGAVGTVVTGAPETPPMVAAPSTTAREGLGQAPAGRMPLRGIRRATARTMTQAWSTIPHIHGWDEIDASALLDSRARLRSRLGEEANVLTPLPFLALAATRALRRYPLVNASIDLDREEIVVHEEVHLGIAVATDAGLIVPVVRHADRRSLLDLAREISRLAAATRDRSVRPEELRGGTFTVTNYGSLGGRFAAPIVLPGQAGILGFGAVRERAIAVEGEVVARPTLPICFGADHRLVDGDLSVTFQECVKDLLTDPLQLLLGE